MPNTITPMNEQELIGLAELLRLAEAGYEAYRADTGGVSVATGAPIPEWSMLRPAIQRAWCAAAKGIVAALPPLKGGPDDPFVAHWPKDEGAGI